MAEVDLSEVSRRHPDGSWALSGVTLHVDDGEILVLTGPSGSGKTTTLRVIAGLEPATSGAIRIGPDIVNGVSVEQRDVALVTQEHTLYPHLTVGENLRFPLLMRQTPRGELQERVAAEARVLGLRGLLTRRPNTLSEGQRQAASLGRATTRTPRVFLFDEPLHALDAAERARVRTELRVFLKGIGATAVYVTNDQLEAMTMGDRVAVLRDGRVQQVGTAQELLEQPADRFVAGFFGNPGMTFARALVVEEGALAWYVVAGQRLRIPASLPGPLRPWRGREVVVGVRSWDLGDARADPYHRVDAVLRARVERFERHGHEDLVELSVGGDHLFARFAAGSAPPAGTPVEIAVDTDRVQVFDPDTGRAVWHGRS